MQETISCHYIKNRPKGPKLEKGKLQLLNELEFHDAWGRSFHCPYSDIQGTSFLFGDSIPRDTPFRKKMQAIQNALLQVNHTCTSNNQQSSAYFWGKEELIRAFEQGLNSILAGYQEKTTEHKTCPYCAETIKLEAVRCRYCGADLKEPSLTTVQQRIVTITRDIQIDGQLAFQHGERVEIEQVSPDAIRPDNKYVVVSKSLNKRFRLSDKDISAELE